LRREGEAEKGISKDKEKKAGERGGKGEKERKDYDKKEKEGGKKEGRKE
jgi:hypothetical protein